MLFDLGDTVPLAVDVLDADGAPTAATSVTLTVDLPDGTTVNPTPANPSVGRYEFDYVTVQAGRHSIRWVSTEPATAFADLIDVRPAAPRYLMSLATMKAHLNITSSADDEELRGYMEAATEVIERHLGETVARATVTGETHQVGRGRTRVTLDRWPVLALTAVTSGDGAHTYDVDDFIVDRATGIVTGPAMYGTVAVSYLAGPAQVKSSYALAAQIIAAHLWETQRNAGVGQQTGFGGEEIMASSGAGYAIPHRAMELLGGPGVLVG